MLMRIDEKRKPTAYKCATVSSEELVKLRKIKNIIRSGRIETLEKDRIVFKDKRLVLKFGAKLIQIYVLISDRT